MSKRNIIPGDTFSIRIPLNIDIKVIEWINKQTSSNASIIELIKREVANGELVDLSYKSNSLPTKKALIPFIVECISKSHDSNIGTHISSIYDYCALKLNVTQAEMDISSKGNNSLYENRVRFSILKLKEQGLIISTRRGFYTLSDLGKRCVENGIEVDNFDSLLDSNYIHQKIKNEIL